MTQTQFGLLPPEREEEIIGLGVSALQSQFHSFFLRRELRVRDWEESLRILRKQMCHTFIQNGMKAKQADIHTIRILESMLTQLVTKEFAHIINPNEKL